MEFKIKIYTTPDCYKCKMIKQALSVKWVEFEELSAIDNFDIIKDSWYMSAPVVVVNDIYMGWEEFMQYALDNKII